MVATATNETGLEIDPALEDAGSGPEIVSLRSAKNPPAGVRVPAFRINGTTYSIATRPKTNTSLKYVHLSRTQGKDIAIDFMLETLLGKEGYEALIEFDDLTEDDLTAVIKAATKIMAGAAEAPKGRPPKGSRRSAG
jgi:hypothetical protein